MRKLSCFFCREFLWPYKDKRLDSDRTLLIDEHLKECEDCRELYERADVSRTILHELSNITPSPELLNYLKTNQRYVETLLRSWGLGGALPTIKWAAQLSIVGLIIVVLVHVLPWRHVGQEIKKLRPFQRHLQEQLNMAQSPPQPMPGALLVANMSPTPSPSPHHELATVAKKSTPAPIAMDTPTPIPEAVAMAEETPRASADPSASSVKIVMADDSEKVTGQATDEEKMQGYVWRGTMTVEELTDDVADRVTDLIKSLGGRKARHVELGWRRGDDRYYHFILPEENYEKLLAGLNEDGIVELHKEKHPLVMKDGEMRIILLLTQEPSDQQTQEQTDEQ